MSDPSFVPRPGTWTVAAGTAELLADDDRPGSYLLAVEGVAQSYVDLLEPTFLEFGYVRLLSYLVRTSGLPAGRGSLVHIGGGAATLARYVEARFPPVEQVVIESDEALAQGLAQRIGSGSFRLVIGDGRNELAALPDGSAGGVITDAFVGPRIPAWLATAEYLQVVRRVLRDDGWYAVNVADAGGLGYARRVTATVREVFPNCVVLAEPAVMRGRRFGNLVIAGSAAQLPVAELSRLAAADAEAPARVLAGLAVDEFRDGAKPLADAEGLGSPVPPDGAFTIR